MSVIDNVTLLSRDHACHLFIASSCQPGEIEKHESEEEEAEIRPDSSLLSREEFMSGNKT